MANEDISSTIDNASVQLKKAFDKLLGSKSFNTVPLLLFAAAWLFTGDVYIIAFSAIAAVGPATKAESALLPLIVSIIVRKNNRTVSRAALAVAAACYIGVMPSLATA